jgi:glycosyltransferase involved in cell wall biosynthesis
LKLACVIHRFGADIAGGSEGHCRGVAEHLAAHHDITILTTCARDHITWQNEYPAGLSTVGTLPVRRFPVVRTRSLHRFAEISELVFSGAASEPEQERWFRENGPVTPALLEFLERHGADYDWILFWSFRYYQTFFGLPLVADRAVLVPTAEEDPLIRGAGILGRFFTLPAGFVFLTPEEEALVAVRSPRSLAPSCVIGSGFEPARPVPAALPAALEISRPFVLYLGRIDPNKGCETLLRHFLKYQTTAKRAVSLVMAGPANMAIPDHPAVRCLGFVDEAVREALLSNASLLIVPSRYESLSIVLLEAWNHGVPALVNGRCSVLKGQAIRANGALYYESFDEFARVLDYLLDRPNVARQLGQQGLAYVNSEYRWPRVIQKLELFLGSLSHPGHRR